MVGLAPREAYTVGLFTTMGSIGLHELSHMNLLLYRQDSDTNNPFSSSLVNI